MEKKARAHGTLHLPGLDAVRVNNVVWTEGNDLDLSSGQVDTDRDFPADRCCSIDT